MAAMVDISLVKEQLRLLGHSVPDEVIQAFVNGLAAGDAGGGATQAQPPDAPRAAGGGADSPAKAADAGSKAAARCWRPSTADSDAAPSRLQQAPDQQSPKRPLSAGQQRPGGSPGSTAPAAGGRPTLDQRCRTFLARLSDRPQLLPHGHDRQRPSLCVPRAAAAAAHAAEDAAGSDAGSSALELSDDDELLRATSLAAAASARRSADAAGSSDDDEGGGSVEPAVAARLERLRARLTARMAGSGHSGRSDTASHQWSRSDARAAGADAAQAAAAAQPPVPASGALPGSISGGAGSGSQRGSGTGCALAALRSSSEEELPRFGFRRGYRPAGLHLPPPLGAGAQDALAAAAALRGPKPVPSPGSGGSTGAAATAAAASLAHGGHCWQLQQAQQLGLGEAAGAVAGRSGLAVVPAARSPAKAAMPAGAGCSIISDAAAGHARPHAPRRPAGSASPRDDPLFYRAAPASPSSEPGTPLPSPSCSAAAARLPAVGLSSSAVRARPGPNSGSGPAAGRALPPPALHAPAAGAAADSRPASAAPSLTAPASTGRRVSSSAFAYSQRLAYGGARGAVAPGVRRTDRVARFQALQAQWQRDRFLSSGAGGAATGATSGRKGGSGGGAQ